MWLLWQQLCNRDDVIKNVFYTGQTASNMMWMWRQCATWVNISIIMLSFLSVLLYCMVVKLSYTKNYLEVFLQLIDTQMKLAVQFWLKIGRRRLGHVPNFSYCYVLFSKCLILRMSPKSIIGMVHNLAFIT